MCQLPVVDRRPGIPIGALLHRSRWRAGAPDLQLQEIPLRQLPCCSCSMKQLAAVPALHQRLEQGNIELKPQRLHALADPTTSMRVRSASSGATTGAGAQQPRVIAGTLRRWSLRKPPATPAPPSAPAPGAAPAATPGLAPDALRAGGSSSALVSTRSCAARQQATIAPPQRHRPPEAEIGMTAVRAGAPAPRWLRGVTSWISAAGIKRCAGRGPSSVALLAVTPYTLGADGRSTGPDRGESGSVGRAAGNPAPRSRNRIATSCGAGGAAVARTTLRCRLVCARGLTRGCSPQSEPKTFLHQRKLRLPRSGPCGSDVFFLLPG